MPFGPYKDFADCVAKNQDKRSPEGYCAAIEKAITGNFPGEMSNRLPAEAWPVFLTAYLEAMQAGQEEGTAVDAGNAALMAAGWQESAGQWFQAPDMKTIAGITIFSAGTWVDSAGNIRDWTIDDLDAIVTAYSEGLVIQVWDTFDLPKVKCGHTSDSFNNKVAAALGVPVEVLIGEEGSGAASIGKVIALRREGNDLIGVFGNVPQAIAELVEAGLYSSVSAEIDDFPFGPALTGVALLGNEDPALPTRDGLAAALVFQTKRDGVVYRFSKADEEVPSELKAYADEHFQGNVDALISWAGRVGFTGCVTALRGQPGIADPERLCGWLKARAGGHSKEDNQMPDPIAIRDMTLSQFCEQLNVVPDDLKALFTLLALEDTATFAAMFSAIEALHAKAEAAPAGDNTQPGEIPEVIKTEFANMKSTIDKQAATINRFEHNERVQKYMAFTSKLDTIEGTPEELASSLAKIEEEAGETVAQGVQAAYKAADDARKAAGLLAPRGSARKEGEKEDEFEKAVQAYADEHKLSYEKAMAEYSVNHTREFAAYRQRVAQAEQVG